MGKFTSAPVYLDARSGFNERQIKKINGMIKSQVNLLTSKAVQKQEEKTQLKDSVTGISWRVLQYSGWQYGDEMMIYATIDISRLSEEERVPLLTIDEEYNFINWTGWLDANQTISLSDNGTLSFEGDTIYITMNNIVEGYDIVSINIRGMKWKA